MKALDLADKYADAVAAYRLESLYGISESCTLEKLEARDESFEALEAELCRLAAVEAERDELKAELEDAKQAAKTWENEAERRSDRYTKCAAELERIKALEPVAWQHKKPLLNDFGSQIGYTDWQDGKGLKWWPHRQLYALGSKT